MAWVLSIFKALAALPAIIQAFRQLLGVLEDKFGPDWPARLEELRLASEKWDAAQSTKERTDAAKALAGAFNSRK